MSGTHRRPERYPILEWLKSAGWLAALVLALLLPLTLLGLLGGVIYIAATDSAADPVIFVAVLGICWVGAAVDLTTTVRRAAAPGPRRRLDRVEAATVALVATLALLSAISQQQGWTHGQLTSITVWLLAPLVLLMPLYRLGGKRRLMSAMEKRAATRPGRTA